MDKIATPNFDRINPRNCINSKIKKLQRKLTAAYESKLKPFGLQGSMLSILFIVGKNPGTNQKTLADILILDPSTMSRDISKLQKRGWLAAAKGEDPRNSVLSLTIEGYLLLEEVSPVWETLHHRVSSILGSFSIQQIDTITEAITLNFEGIKA